MFKISSEKPAFFKVQIVYTTSQSILVTKLTQVSGILFDELKV